MVPPSVSPSSDGDASGRSRREATLGHLQPFGADICADWHEPGDLKSVPLHERALEELRSLVDGGRVVLLSAPRAGHGKTHLLARVAAKLQGEALVAGLPWQSIEGLTWAGCGRGLLQDLAAGTARPNLLQQACGGVLATLLRRLIQTGRIPSTDPVQALRVLSQDPMELFSESGNAKVIGEWFRRHFDPLRKPLAEISSLDGPEAVEDWLRGFFDYIENPSQAVLAALCERIDRNGAAQVSRFLRLVTAWKPLVLVADHMDGLYRDVESGVAVARMALALASLPGVHVVLSINQDVWDTTFGRQLPSALEDRLSARSIALHGLVAEDARALVRLRLTEAGVGEDDQRDFLQFLDLDRFFLGRAIGSVSARGLLRHASQMWRHWLQAGDADRQESTPADQGHATLPAGGFLAEDARESGSVDTRQEAVATGMQAPPAFEAQESEDLEKLAQHLAADAGARLVRLSSEPVELTSPVPAAAASLPPGVVPLVAPVLKEPPPPRPPVAAEAAPRVPPAPRETPPSSVVAAPPPTFVVVPSPPPAASSQEREAGSSVERTPRPPQLVEAPANTFHKLRQMLAKLKVATDSVPLPDTALAPPAVSETAASTAIAQGMAAAVGKGIASASPAADLRARFEKIRYDIAKTTRPAAVELPVLSELIRLAGKRFPVVNYDEVELPGLLGRSLPRWSLQGTELVFGLESFGDTRYWKTVSSYVAGRLAELNASAAQNGTPPLQLKLVVFKGDMEGAGLVALLRDEIIPATLRVHVDAVHLDPRSLASLYAMHQLIREAETGTLQVDATAILGALAGELDFFWKRVTRPKA